AAAVKSSMATGPRREGGGEGRNRPAVGGGVWAGGEAALHAAGRGGGRRRSGQVPGGGVAPERLGENGDAPAVVGGRTARRREPPAGAEDEGAGAEDAAEDEAPSASGWIPLARAVNRHPL